jgi:hypothetical protein
MKADPVEDEVDDIDLPPFDPVDMPTYFTTSRKGWRWVEFTKSKLPLWRRLAACMPDGRVLLPALNVFQNYDVLDREITMFGRPVAVGNRQGQRFVEVDFLRHFLADDRQGLLRAIELMVKAAAAGKAASDFAEYSARIAALDR